MTKGSSGHCGSPKGNFQSFKLGFAFFAFCFLAKLWHTNRNEFPREVAPCWGNVYLCRGVEVCKSSWGCSGWAGVRTREANSERCTWKGTKWGGPWPATQSGLDPDHVGKSLRPVLLSLGLWLQQGLGLSQTTPELPQVLSSRPLSA